MGVHIHGGRARCAPNTLRNFTKGASIPIGVLSKAPPTQIYAIVLPHARQSEQWSCQRCIYPAMGPTRAVSIPSGARQKLHHPRMGRAGDVAIPIGIVPEGYPSPYSLSTGARVTMRGLTRGVPIPTGVVPEVHPSLYGSYQTRVHHSRGPTRAVSILWGSCGLANGVCIPARSSQC